MHPVMMYETLCLKLLYGTILETFSHLVHMFRKYAHAMLLYLFKKAFQNPYGAADFLVFLSLYCKEFSGSVVKKNPSRPNK